MRNLFFLGKVQFEEMVLDSLTSHTVSSFATLRMTRPDLSFHEKLSSAFEPCLMLGRTGGSLLSHSHVHLSYKWLVTIAITLGMFMSLMDSTIVNVAIPQMQHAFGADIH